MVHTNDIYDIPTALKVASYILQTLSIKLDTRTFYYGPNQCDITSLDITSAAFVSLCCYGNFSNHDDFPFLYLLLTRCYPNLVAHADRILRLSGIPDYSVTIDYSLLVPSRIYEVVTFMKDSLSAVDVNQQFTVTTSNTSQQAEIQSIFDVIKKYSVEETSQGPSTVYTIDKSPSEASPCDKSPSDASPCDKSPSDASPCDKSPSDDTIDKVLTPQEILRLNIEKTPSILSQYDILCSNIVMSDTNRDIFGNDEESKISHDTTTNPVFCQNPIGGIDDIDDIDEEIKTHSTKLIPSRLKKSIKLEKLSTLSSQPYSKCIQILQDHLNTLLFNSETYPAVPYFEYTSATLYELFLQYRHHDNLLTRMGRDETEGMSFVFVFFLFFLFFKYIICIYIYFTGKNPWWRLSTPIKIATIISVIAFLKFRK